MLIDGTSTTRMMLSITTELPIMITNMYVPNIFLILIKPSLCDSDIDVRLITLSRQSIVQRLCITILIWRLENFLTSQTVVNHNRLSYTFQYWNGFAFSGLFHP